MSQPVKITWLGHACFLIETMARILTDPFQKIGYPEPAVKTDVVTVSHQHHDHNAVGILPGEPRVIAGEGRHTADGVEITGIVSYHDSSGGTKRGPNTIFVIEAGGVRVCHLGDLGHVPDQSIIGRIGKVDALLVPVGGFYTINAEEAKQAIELINPAYAVPMHYKTQYINFPIAPVDDFLQFFPGYIKQDALVISPGQGPDKTQVVVLDLFKQE